MGAPIVTGHLVAGRYRLLTPLGNGGMGTVWQAEDELLARLVAVKEISPPPDVSPQERALLRERTLREARTAARLSHPNVVTIYDVVEDDGRPWIVMELIAARSLRDLVLANGPLSAQHAAQIGLQVLAALTAAHSLGILHRDVKPGNVLIDAAGRAVLADFGIARTQDSPTLTTSGVLVGSPSYIAPERASGEPGGPESDLWSLGATLYAIVEGRPPYDRAGALPTLMAVVHEDPDPPARAGPLWPVIRSLLDHVPSRRPDAGETERMLRRVAEGISEPGTAPLPAQPEPAGRPFDSGASLAAAEQTRTFHPGETAHLQPPGEAEAEPSSEVVAEPAHEVEPQPPVAVLPHEIEPQPPGEVEAEPPGDVVAEPAHEVEPQPPGEVEAEPPDDVVAEPAQEAEPQPPGEPAAELPVEPEPEPDSRSDRPSPAPPDQPAPHPLAGLLRADAPQRRRRPSRPLVAAIAVAVLATLTGVVFALVTASQHGTPSAAGRHSHPATGHATQPRPTPSATGPATSRPTSSRPSGSRAGGGPPVIPAGWHDFHNSTGFSIAVPNGWRVSHQGHYVYVLPPSGTMFLLIDQSDHPQPNPLADWQQQEANRRGSYPGYRRIRLQAVPYAQAEKAADWEFTYYRQGVLTHVLNRNVLANADHAYALYWSTPASQWQREWHLFEVFARTFRPAPA
ncbi:MAG TPA: protein kinase [Streptosporangiaceae bacterium]